MTKKMKLDSQKIIAAAVQIADHSGIDALSMRRLANGLGVEAMSLYHYFANKEEIVAAMVDSVVPIIEPAELCTDWIRAMKQRARVMRETLIMHPWAAHEFVSGVNIGPNMLAYSNTTVGYLREAGFSYQMTDYAWNIIDCYVYGFNLQERNFPFDSSEYKQAAKHYLDMIPRDKYPYTHDMALRIIDGSHDGVQDFEFGLDLILEGLERMRKKQLRRGKNHESSSY
jgi:AcrR family transcriptional regulator